MEITTPTFAPVTIPAKAVELSVCFAAYSSRSQTLPERQELAET